MKVILLPTDEGSRYGLVEEGVVYALEGDLFGGQGSRGEVIGELPDLRRLLPPVRPSKNTSFICP